VNDCSDGEAKPGSCEQTADGKPSHQPHQKGSHEQEREVPEGDPYEEFSGLKQKRARIEEHSRGNARVEEQVDADRRKPPEETDRK
jgi:hypothetical protein